MVVFIAELRFSIKIINEGGCDGGGSDWSLHWWKHFLPADTGSKFVCISFFFSFFCLCDDWWINTVAVPAPLCSPAAGRWSGHIREGQRGPDGKRWYSAPPVASSHHYGNEASSTGGRLLWVGIQPLLTAVYGPWQMDWAYFTWPGSGGSFYWFALCL